MARSGCKASPAGVQKFRSLLIRQITCPGTDCFHPTRRFNSVTHHDQLLRRRTNAAPSTPFGKASCLLGIPGSIRFICAGVPSEHCAENNAFYLFCAAFNWFFPIYSALFTLSLYAILCGLLEITGAPVSKWLLSPPNRRLIATFLMLVAVPLAIVELLQ